MVGFNSRTREGATLALQKQKQGFEVSIHAPVKVRHGTFLLLTYDDVSIHAPVKVRRSRYYSTGSSGSFNSRTREGATDLQRELTEFKAVSIHAPVKVRP